MYVCISQLIKPYFNVRPYSTMNAAVDYSGCVLACSRKYVDETTGCLDNHLVVSKHLHLVHEQHQYISHLKQNAHTTVVAVWGQGEEW